MNSNIKNIKDFFFHLENPQIFTGLEINAIKKKFSTQNINICLVFPDKYEIGMSHYGLILLYHFLNTFENVSVERAFLPEKSSIERFKLHNIPIFSLENKIPLDQFDIIGFSLLSEMNFTNILEVLDLAKIPLHTEKRPNTFPLIIAGGISSINPEPIRDFIDVFSIGDGEALFPDIIAAVSKAKNQRMSKLDLLEHFNDIQGLYVPALFPPVKKGRFYTPNLKPGSIKKRVFNSLEKSFPPSQAIVPLGKVVFDRLNIEIARGCPKNCRFCQAKSYYSPYRYRSVANNLQNIFNGLQGTGFEAFSLSTLSTGDYPFINELLQLIPRVISLPGTSFSFSSLRPSTLSHHLLNIMAMFKKTGITIVIEAGSQRLRDVINKDVTDDEIFQAVELALRNKWQRIKLYFMLGLPTETTDDIDEIITLIQRILEMARNEKQKIKLHASFSPFVPKPHTPFQWCKKENLEEIFKRIKRIKGKLKGIRNLDLDFHFPQNSIVETILARGDCRVGSLLLKAFQKGQIFSAWDTDFKFPVWQELINHSEYEDFLQEIPLEETLPWDFIQVNYNKSHLTKEYQKALKTIVSPPCQADKCKQCKGCSYPKKSDTDKIHVQGNFEELIGEKINNNFPQTSNIEFNRVRIFYEKTHGFIFFSQLTMMKYIERLIRQTSMIFKCSEGFTPRMKIISLPPLPVYATGLNEVIEIFIDNSLGEKEILELLVRFGTPHDFKFNAVKICNNSPSLSKDIHFMTYLIKVPGITNFISDISDHLVESDSVSYLDNQLNLKIDYSKQGQERFAKIYKLLDPEKKHTRFLTRTNVIFKSFF